MPAVDPERILTTLPSALHTTLRMDGKNRTAALIRQGGDPTLELAGEDANERADLYFYAPGMRDMPAILGVVEIKDGGHFLPVTIVTTPRRYQVADDLFMMTVEINP